MHKIILLLVVLLGHFAYGQTQSPYQIQSCKIEFVFNNGVQKGTKTLVFIDSGKVEKMYGVAHVDTSANSEIPKQFIGSRTVYHSLTIQTNDSVFTADLDSMTGNRRERFGMSSPPTDMIRDNKIGVDSFLNRKCDLIDFHGAKIWYWKGIALKKEVLAGQIYEYATSIDEKYIIQKDEFILPANIKTN